MTAANSTAPVPSAPWVAHPATAPLRESAPVRESAPARVPRPAGVPDTDRAPAPARRPAHQVRSPEWLLSRARALWPGLPSRQLAGTRGDPLRIVRLVARRSNEAPEVLLAMLLGVHGGTSRR